MVASSRRVRMAALRSAWVRRTRRFADFRHIADRLAFPVNLHSDRNVT